MIGEERIGFERHPAANDRGRLGKVDRRIAALRVQRRKLEDRLVRLRASRAGFCVKRFWLVR